MNPVSYTMSAFYGDNIMAQVSFRMDDELKDAADRMFRGMGMNLSVAINIFVTQAVRRQKFPFEIEGDPFYSESNLAVLRRRASDMDAGSRRLVERSH